MFYSVIKYFCNLFAHIALSKTYMMLFLLKNLVFQNVSSPFLALPFNIQNQHRFTMVPLWNISYIGWIAWK